MVTNYKNFLLLNFTIYIYIYIFMIYSLNENNYNNNYFLSNYNKL